MVCKDDFLNIMMAHASSYNALKKMEDAMGVNIDEGPMIEYLYQGDVIAFHLLNVQTNPVDTEVLDHFLSSYWMLMDNDKVLYHMPDLKEVVIHNSEQFYEFWVNRKDFFPIKVERYIVKNFWE